MTERLNLGCGSDYREGWVNVDIDPSFDPDEVIDLESDSWPLPSETFDLVLADNVFEHIDPRKRPTFLREVHRVLKPDGQLKMRWPTPGFGGGWDITHYQIPSWEWPEHPDNQEDWEIQDLKFEFTTIGKLIPRRVAVQLMWHGIRTVSSVEVSVTPKGNE